jgi:hypothetical protein
MVINTSTEYMGKSQGCSSFSQDSRSVRKQEHPSSIFGVDANILHQAYSTSSSNRIWLLICPTSNTRLVGDLELPPFAAYRQMAAGGKPAKTVEVFCKPEDSKTGNNLIICLVCIVRMVENYPIVELFLRPHLVIMNNLFFDEMHRHL